MHVHIKHTIELLFFCLICSLATPACRPRLTSIFGLCFRSLLDICATTLRCTACEHRTLHVRRRVRPKAPCVVAEMSQKAQLEVRINSKHSDFEGDHEGKTSTVETCFEGRIMLERASECQSMLAPRFRSLNGSKRSATNDCEHSVASEEKTCHGNDFEGPAGTECDRA